MALLVLNYPTISAADFAWVQEIRRQYDTLYYDVVAPHFTLIFPVFDRERGTFCAHIRRQLQDQAPIAFELRCAIVVKDVLSDTTHTFLVPDRGFSDLVRLHDKLYEGELADQLRLDIPFIPHIGVATSLDPLVCKQVADEINRQRPCVAGTVGIVDIVQYVNRTVTTLEQIPLA